MIRSLIIAGVVAVAPLSVALAHGTGETASLPGQQAVAATAPTDARIAHIAYTAGQLDIAAAKQALEKSSNPEVRTFAELMARDHAAVNVQALALLERLHVTPEDNPTSIALTEAAAATNTRLAGLSGPAFDAAYVAHELAYHRTVNDALRATLIPGARNAELKSLLQTGLTLFEEHQVHAEHLARDVH